MFDDWFDDEDRYDDAIERLQLLLGGDPHEDINTSSCNRSDEDTQDDVDKS